MRILLIKGILHLFALLSLKTVHRISTGVARIIMRYPSLRINKITHTNINLCFPQNQALITESLIETCKTFGEMGALWLWKKDKVLELVRAVSGDSYLQAAVQRGKGVILLTPHLGAWELIGLYTATRYALTVLYRPPKMTQADDFIRTARERTGVRCVPTNHTGIRALYQALRRGQVAGILPDQVPVEEGSGIFVPFFGIQAYSMVLVYRLARKTGATVIFTYAERLPKGQGFHIHFLEAPKDIMSDNKERSVAALNQGVERCIRSCPSQYQWSYKRFKRRPDGEESVY